MDDTGPWRLELEVSEYRMGHLLTALEQSADGTLPVEYVPATAVEKTYAATLTCRKSAASQMALSSPRADISSRLVVAVSSAIV